MVGRRSTSVLPPPSDSQYPEQSTAAYNSSHANKGGGTRSCLAFRLPNRHARQYSTGTSAATSGKYSTGISPENVNEKSSLLLGQSDQYSLQSHGWEAFQTMSNEEPTSPQHYVQSNKNNPQQQQQQFTSPGFASWSGSMPSAAQQQPGMMLSPADSSVYTTQQQQQQQQQNPVTRGATFGSAPTPLRNQSNNRQEQTTTSPRNTSSTIESLLVPPTPVDRSPQTVALQRQQQQQQQNRSNSNAIQHRPGRPRVGLYEGEMEPGVRGQEAQVVMGTRTTTTVGAGGTPSQLGGGGSGGGGLQILSPAAAPNQSGSAGVYGYPSATRRQQQQHPGSSAGGVPHHHHQQQHQLPPLGANNRPSKAHHQQQQYPRRSPEIADDSTTSSDDIRHMIADLVPPSVSTGDDQLPEQPPRKNRLDDEYNHNHHHHHGATTTTANNNTQRHQVVTPSPDQPSLAAQRAAAAAAGLAASNNHAAAGTTAPSLSPATQRQLDQHNAHAMDCVHAGDYRGALHHFGTVLQLQQQLHPHQPHAAVAAAHHNLGTVHAKQASLLSAEPQRRSRAAALQEFQSAARTARDSLGPNHPNVAVSLVRIGFILLQSRQYTNAVVTFQEALRIRRAHYGPHHGLVANLHNNLGVCYMHLEKFPDGEAQLQAALQVQRLVVSQTQRKQEQQQQQQQRAAGGQQQQRSSDDHWLHLLELADTLFNIGGLSLEWMRRQGPDARRARQAEESFQEALEIRSSVLGPNDPSVQRVRMLYDTARAMPRPKSDVGSTGPISSTSPARRKHPRAESGDHQSNGNIFREAGQLEQRHQESGGAERSARHAVPLPQVSVSRDEGDDDNVSEGGGARVYVAPHLIPETARAGGTNPDESNEAVGTISTDFAPDTSVEHHNHRQQQKSRGGVTKRSFSYDSEENCMLNDNGVDSQHGRVHYPQTWQQNGEQRPSSGRPSGATNPDLVLAQPYREQPQDNQPSTSLPPPSQLRKTSSSNSDQWGSETVNFSTGNKDRDAVLERARALLMAHPSIAEEEDAISGANTDDAADTMRLSRGLSKSRSGENERPSEEPPQAQRFEPDLLEDGIAPLGGQWASPDPERPRPLHAMLADPMNNLVGIHEEASRQLKENNAVDALRLFEVVLGCQQRRHGPLHPDVASALHNVGISHLRSHNYAEALKAFENTARVRKGSLGKDHPHVAVSLVKVGITLLLLHRFDDALWTFREALSVRKHALGPLHPSTARIYNNIGCVHVEFNEFRDARRAFEAALDVQRNALVHDKDNATLMFGTATTLCNLGYLYRYRDMHAKASLVLKEAVELQERVLGRSHSTVLSTMDNLADSYANCGHPADALKTYDRILERFRVGEGRSQSAEGRTRSLRAEAVLLFKISRIHGQRHDHPAQLESLKMALAKIRSYTESAGGGAPDSLERRIQHDIRACREQIEKAELKYV